MAISPDKITTTLLKIAADVASDALDGRQSMSEFNQSIQMTPSVLFDRGFTRLDPDFQNDLAQNLLDRYIANYMMSVTRLTKIGSVSVEEILAPLSTDASFAKTASHVSMDVPEWNTQDNDLVDYDAPELTHEAAQSGIDTDLSKPSALAIGKVIRVPLYSESGDKSLVVAVLARINPMALESKFLVRLLEAFIGNDNSILGRWHKYWANEISLYDYLTSTDIVREERKLELEDKTGWYHQMKQQFRSNFLTRLLGGRKGQNVASATIVLLQETALEMENSMRGEFKSFRQREQFFKATGSFQLVIINPAAQRVKIYERGAPSTGNYLFSQFKTATGSGASNALNDLMKAYRQQESLG